MKMIINTSSMVPIYEQIINIIKDGIINGELRENDPLPSVRALSRELRISALTVKKAYDILENDGFTVTVHGKGSYIAPYKKELILEARKKELENDIEGLLLKAKQYGIDSADLRKMIDIIMEDE